MLNFIVLGQIPGTNTRLGFTLVLFIYLVVVFGVIWLVDKNLILKRLPAKLQKILRTKRSAIK